MFCEQNHKGHSITNYGKLLLDKNKIDNSLKQFEEKKNKLNNDINEIIIKLNKVKENFVIYFNIMNNIIKNYNKEKINYEIVY